MTTSGAKRLDPDHFQEVLRIPPLDEIKDGDLFTLSLSNKTNTLTHGLHRFAAKFIPQIPAWALDNFAHEDSVVLDPFMGSGTTLVEGTTRAGTYIGVDIDPLARFIAGAKTVKVDHNRVIELGDEIRMLWSKPAATLQPPMPDIQNFDHWFEIEQWGWLQSLREVILVLEGSDAERNFLLAVFSSCLRRVSRADDQSQNCLLYTSDAADE